MLLISSPLPDRLQFLLAALLPPSKRAFNSGNDEINAWRSTGRWPIIKWWYRVKLRASPRLSSLFRWAMLLDRLGIAIIFLTPLTDVSYSWLKSCLCFFKTIGLSYLDNGIQAPDEKIGLRLNFLQFFCWTGLLLFIPLPLIKVFGYFILRWYSGSR